MVCRAHIVSCVNRASLPDARTGMSGLRIFITGHAGHLLVRCGACCLLTRFAGGDIRW
jgi:hypothetical protein